MKIKHFAAALFALGFYVSALGLLALSPVAAKAAPAAPAQYHDQDRGDWDAPPPEFKDVQRRGFRDGIEGARKDFDNHRRPDVNNRDEYRHPPVERAFRNDYRDGFRRGYERAMSHLMGEGPH